MLVSVIPEVAGEVGVHGASNGSLARTPPVVPAVVPGNQADLTVPVDFLTQKYLFIFLVVNPSPEGGVAEASNGETAFEKSAAIPSAGRVLDR